MGVDFDFSRRAALANAAFAFVPRLSVLKFPSLHFRSYAEADRGPQCRYLTAMRSDPLDLERGVLTDLAVTMARHPLQYAARIETDRELLVRSLRIAARRRLIAPWRDAAPVTPVLRWLFQRKHPHGGSPDHLQVGHRAADGHARESGSGGRAGERRPVPGAGRPAEILRGFGEFGETLDPSCQTGGSREGSCGGDAYVPWGEFYAIANGKLVRQEVVGSYGQASYTDGASLTATIDTGSQTACQGPNATVQCKATDPFETPGQPNPGPAIGASATATFSDVVVIADDKTTIANESGQAGGDKLVTLTITNTPGPGSGIYLTSFNFQTKRRGPTDINALDGTSIQGRQDLDLGAAGTLRLCNPDDPFDAQCFDSASGIGRFPNVIGNSLFSSTFVHGFGHPLGPVEGKLESIKKNGTFQPLMKTDLSAANFICIKSGAQSEDQDADETCSGNPTDGSGNPLGLAPGESQSVRLELDYGDFRGLILRVAPGTPGGLRVAPG